jgi:hypothetical protein
MRIVFQKAHGQRHVLRIIHEDGSSEHVECETRSYLIHDLLHYAVETEARLSGGFWGNLAGGKTLTQMNDRSQPVMAAAPEMLVIEQIVGAMSGAVKGRSADAIVSALLNLADATDRATPRWLTTAFVAAVQERMRRLLGRWNATASGGSMELPWPES